MGNQKIKYVQIHKDLLSYRTAVRGDWVFKVSVYKDQQVMVIAFNSINGEFVTRMFDNYDDVVIFLEYLAQRGDNWRKFDFPEL